MYVLPLEIAYDVITALNDNLSDYAPYTVIAGTIAATFVLHQAYQLYERWDPRQIKNHLTDKAIHAMAQLPHIGPKIQAKINKEVTGMLDGIRADIQAQRAEWETIETLPEEGLSAETIQQRFQKLNLHYKPSMIPSY